AIGRKPLLRSLGGKARRSAKIARGAALGVERDVTVEAIEQPAELPVVPEREPKHAAGHVEGRRKIAGRGALPARARRNPDRYSEIRTGPVVGSMRFFLCKRGPRDVDGARLPAGQERERGQCDAAGNECLHASPPMLIAEGQRGPSIRKGH